ncbi:hypothetical protein EDD86DRAFT_206658 [Gorgonomyces haynaldii]|nr:hypothetical protein EDD86DRAFT_206658 [Gorgonomyces haynaldii]
MDRLKRLYSIPQSIKKAPGTHLVAFGILHEITAIVPLPLVYYYLSANDVKIPFPEQILEEGNKRVGKMMQYLGFETLDPKSQTMLHLATSYAVVKAAMPLRVGLSLLLTPGFARLLQFRR